MRHRQVSYGRIYFYLELDGYKYWVLGKVINRERLRDDPPRL